MNFGNTFEIFAVVKLTIILKSSLLIISLSPFHSHNNINAVVVHQLVDYMGRAGLLTPVGSAYRAEICTWRI